MVYLQIEVYDQALNLTTESDVGTEHYSDKCYILT
jgi:hypothetical protein